MNQKALKTLEYNKIIAQLEEYASTQIGKTLCRELVPSCSLEEIRRKKQREAAPPRDTYTDARPAASGRAPRGRTYEGAAHARASAQNGNADTSAQRRSQRERRVDTQTNRPSARERYYDQPAQRRPARERYYDPPVQRRTAREPYEEPPVQRRTARGPYEEPYVQRRAARDLYEEHPEYGGDQSSYEGAGGFSFDAGDADDGRDPFAGETLDETMRRRSSRRLCSARRTTVICRCGTI